MKAHLLNPQDISADIYQRPAELLQRLIRFDTSNPPGNEAACIHFLRDLLEGAGIPVDLIGHDPNRPNLLARLSGVGSAPPLLLYGHADVVPTANQAWTYPPFEGRLADGFVWGRGTLDMKGGLAMMVSALLKARLEAIPLPGDVILAVVVDEEVGGPDGARCLVEEHAHRFEGVRYALGEFGGFTLWMGNKCFYPIMLAEKQMCSLKATLRGPGGHGSMPLRGGAMAHLGSLLKKLDGARLPVHITPVARLMIEAIGREIPFPAGPLLGQLLNPALCDRVLDLLGSQASLFDPMLHNTASPTIVRGGDKINVIPSEIILELDGRLLPGQTPDDILRELRALAGDDVEFAVTRYDQGPAQPNLGLFETLCEVLRAVDPQGIPMPMLLSAVTDARFFSRLGIQTYGFTPMQLPPSFNFSRTIHAADERIPVEAVQFGTQAIFQVLTCFGE